MKPGKRARKRAASIRREARRRSINKAKKLGLPAPVFRNLDTYSERHKVLYSLGFKSYADYLVSGLWKKIRQRAFIINGRTCKLCPAKADVLHHQDYTRETLLGKKISNLKPICNACHSLIEFDENGVKRSFRSVQLSYEELEFSRLWEERLETVT